MCVCVCVCLCVCVCVCTEDGVLCWLCVVLNYDFCMYTYIYIYCLHVSSPYLLVFSDDRVMHYTEANDVAGGSSEA